LPIVNGSSGTWGTILNAALTDIDNRLTSVTTNSTTNSNNLTSLTSRVTTLESAGSAGGKLTVATSTTRPPLTVGQIVLETDTGFMYYAASVAGTATRVPFPGSYLAKLRQTATQNLTTSQATALTFNSIDYDRMGAYSGTRYTAGVPGSYEFTGAVAFSTNATGYRGTFWYYNGALVNGSTVNTPAVPGTVAPTVVPLRTVTFKMAAGDYVEAYAIQNSGSTLATENGTQFQSTAQVKYLGYNV
jgi:hypothetical protein